jgi:hypothetical protein
VAAITGIAIKAIVVVSFIDRSKDDWEPFYFLLAVMYGAIPTLWATMLGVGLVLLAIERINERREQQLNTIMRGLLGAAVFAAASLTLIAVVKVGSGGAGFWANSPWLLTGLFYPDLGCVAGALAGMGAGISWSKPARANFARYRA